MNSLTIAQALIMLDDFTIKDRNGRAVVETDSFNVLFHAHSLAVDQGKRVPSRPELWMDGPSEVFVDVETDGVTVLGGDRKIAKHVDHYLRHAAATCRTAMARHATALQSSEVKCKARLPNRQARRFETYAEALLTAAKHAQESDQRCAVQYYGMEPFISHVYPDSSVTTTINGSLMNEIRVQPSPLELISRTLI